MIVKTISACYVQLCNEVPRKPRPPKVRKTLGNHRTSAVDASTNYLLNWTSFHRALHLPHKRHQPAGRNSVGVGTKISTGSKEGRNRLIQHFWSFEPDGHTRGPVGRNPAIVVSAKQLVDVAIAPRKSAISKLCTIDQPPSNLRFC